MSLVRANHRISLKNILFLTDFSEPSTAALPFALMIARAYGAKVTALHVLLPSVYEYMAAESGPIVRDDQEDLAKAEMDRVEAELVGRKMPSCGAGQIPPSNTVIRASTRLFRNSCGHQRGKRNSRDRGKRKANDAWRNRDGDFPSKLSPEQVTELFKHPTAKMTAGGMHPVDLPPDDLKVLIAYLESLK